MTTNIGDIVVKDEVQIRTDGLRTLKNYLVLNCNISNPAVGPGTDYWGLFEAISYEIAPLYANGQIQADQSMPDTATGANLVREGGNVGLAPRNASGSVGSIVYQTSASGLVPTNAQLSDSSGLLFQVANGGTYGSGDLIQVEALSTGSATNHEAGDILTWVSPPPFAAPTAAVANGGLIGGTDAEIDANQESFRARIFQRLQNPAGAGVWTELAQNAVDAHPSVQGAAVYPALQGPGTVFVAVFGFSTWSTQADASRAINATILANVIAPYVIGNIPEHVYAVVAGTTDYPVDVGFALSLPSSPNASPPGPGGGWVDGTPWPPSTCAVTSVTNSLQFTVNATVPPVIGSSIAWLSANGPQTWTVYTGNVTGYSGTSGAYVVTVNSPFVDIAEGNFIFPQSVNQNNYVAAVMNQFGIMGPGEETSNASALARAYRHPLPTSTFPYSLDARMLRAIENAGDEVLSAAYDYKSATTPPLPSTIATAPNIFVPRNIGFYPQ